MLLNGSENEKLFAKLVPICVKDQYTNQPRTRHLFLTMEWQETSAAVYNRKVLSITLTDDDDIYFLYNLHLSEEDFQTLKQKQDLLINFSSFPQHIIKFIENCLQEEKNPQPKFILVFTLNDKLGNVAAPSQLDIIETNHFKHLTHLSLNFIAATESAIRQYQTSCFRHLKEENRQLQNSLTFMEQNLKDKLAACQHTLHCKIEEFAVMKKELEAESKLKETNYERKLQEEKDSLNNVHKDAIERLQKEMKAEESKFCKEIKHLQTRLDILENLNKELENKIYSHECTIRNSRSKVLSLEDEIRHLKDNLQTCNQKNSQLQSEIKEKQSHICKQDEKIKSLQKELRNTKQSLSDLKDNIESEIELKKSVEKELEDKIFCLDMIGKQYQELEIDNKKMNEIIINLQDKTEELTKEEKNKSHLIEKYKKKIEDKDKALLEFKEQVAQLKISLEIQNSQIKTLTESNNSLEKTLDESQKEMKTKNEVIKYLNRKLAESNVMLQYPGPSHVLSPPTDAQKSAGINSRSPENFSPLITGKNAVAKSLRIEASSPVCRRNSSSPSHMNKTAGIDSAYCTTSQHSNQASPEILAGYHNMKFNSSNFDVDQEAISAAFGNGGCNLKHSTAKKPTKPVKSAIPKSSKKR